MNMFVFVSLACHACLMTFMKDICKIFYFMLLYKSSQSKIHIDKRAKLPLEPFFMQLYAYFVNEREPVGSIAINIYTFSTLLV